MGIRCGNAGEHSLQYGLGLGIMFHVWEIYLHKLEYLEDQLYRIGVLPGCNWWSITLSILWKKVYPAGRWEPGYPRWRPSSRGVCTTCAVRVWISLVWRDILGSWDEAIAQTRGLTRRLSVYSWLVPNFGVCQCACSTFNWEMCFR